MKRTLSLFLSLLMVFSLFSGLNITAGAAETDLAEVGAGYGLWVGSTQVTDANKNDILSDGGKAKFDPSTHTLTLSNPTISGVHNNSKIFCSGFDLTLKGSYTMSSAESDIGIRLFDYGLTLDGNFTFLAWCYAVEASGDINVSGGRLTAKLQDGDGEQCQAFCSDAGSITFGDSVEYFEAAVTSSWSSTYAVAYSSDGTVMVSPKLKISTPEGGTFREGSCYYYEGTKRKRAKTVIIEPADPSDIKYDVWVGSTQVTGANKNDILGDGGKAKYDPSTATLTLINPTISTNYSAYGRTFKIYADSDLTVKGSYNLTSYDTDYCIDCYTNLTLNGDFTFMGKLYGVHTRFMLTIDGSLVGRANSTTYTSSAGIYSSEILFRTLTRVEAEGKNVNGIYAERGLMIPPEYEVSVSAASYIEKGTVVDSTTSSPTVAKRVVITPVVDGLGIFLGEKQITESNKSDIFGDGKASYDKDTKTLTLKNPTIRGVHLTSLKQACLIYSKDDITIEGKYNHIDFSCDYGFLCENNMTVNADIIRIGGSSSAIRSEKGNLTINGVGRGELTARAQGSANRAAIDAGNDIAIGSGMTLLEAEGDYMSIRGKTLTVSDSLILTTPEGGMIVNYPGDGSVFESNGEDYAKKAVFTKQIITFDLWLGNVRVTDNNKDDILNDGGKAKFDPDTNTLILSDPVINDFYIDERDRNHMIRAIDMDLTIEGSYQMTEPKPAFPVYIDGELTLNGSFTFLSDNRDGVVSHGLTISGGCVTVRSGSSDRSLRGITCYGEVLIDSGVTSVTAEGAHDGISAYENITIKGGTITASATDVAGMGIISYYGDIIINSGSVTASAKSGSGIYTSKGDIIINGGFVTTSSKSSGCGLYARVGKVSINSGAKRVEALGSSRAIKAGDVINISPELTITVPLGGTVIGGNIYQPDGVTIAINVVIENPNTSHIIGDVDLDGKITISDVTAIQLHVAELNPLTGDALLAADTNGDGTVDITDATHLQLYLAEYDVVLGKK